MLQPGRHANTSDYRYGFQGQEMDDEIKGEGNSLNYTYRMHDPRVGRFFAIDPLTYKYPHYTPYSFSGNRVIDAIELEGLEEKIVHTQYLGNKIYETVLKKSQFTLVQWRVIQKMWYRTIILDAEVNEDNFGGVGFKEYYSAPFDRSRKRFDADKNFWRGNDKGTLYVTDYHGQQMIYGFNGEDAGVGSFKTSTVTLDIIDNLMENIAIASNSVTVASGGTTAIVTVPITKLTEAIGAIANIEKIVIQSVNGDIKQATGTFVKEFAVPASLGKLFDKWRGNTDSVTGKERIDWLESIIQKSINEGLDTVDIPIDNKPITTVRENETGF